jgi:hypothetical protein
MFSKIFSKKKKCHDLKVAAARSPSSTSELMYNKSPVTTMSRGKSFAYSGTNSSDFYRYLRDHIPIISSGIWTWVHLCTTSQRVEIRGEEAQVRSANRVIENLQARIYPRNDGDNNGLRRLTESFFLDLFTLGQFALRVHLLSDGSGISHIEPLDPNRVTWESGEDGIARPYYEDDDGNLESIPPDTFFQRTLITDIHQPEGIEPLASIPFVVEIEQRMLEDMARSSHNAGTQRLQVKIAPPEKMPGEDFETYNKRMNSYFDRTIQQFRDLGPDDNVFTWSDVEVQLVGGSGSEGSVWKLNREQVIEDVITGLKLFPWVLGRSHGTTRNWIFAQYNLLMQIVDSIQQMGSDLSEWLMKLELRLAGNISTPIWHFSPNQDPFIVERNRAKLMELERVERLVSGGYISQDQGARELGYESSFKK